MLDIFRRYPKKEIVEPVISNISTLVRDGNNLFSDTLILLDEKLSGNLFCAETIVVEQNGVLSGNITSKSCVVSGTITGNIVSTEQMDIKSTAVIKGNIKSAAINIEPGAVINGCVTIADDNEAIVADLSEKIKEHTEKDLQDKLYPGIPQLHSQPEPVEAVAINWEVESFEVIDELILDKPAAEIVAPIAELPELNWAINSSDDITSGENDIKQTPVSETPTTEEEPIAPVLPKKKLTAPVPPASAKKDEDSQRWW